MATLKCGYVRLDLDSTPVEELQEWHDKLDAETNKIRADVAMAKARVHTEGEYADPDWYQRATLALKMKNKQVETLRGAIGRRKKEEARASRGRPSRAECFLAVCQESLDEGVFEKLMFLAEQKMRRVG